MAECVGIGNSGTTQVDFGAWPGSNEADTTVAGQDSIRADSETDAWIGAIATTDHTINDHAYAKAFVGVMAGAPSVGTGFAIYVRSTERLTGKFSIQWAWA